MSGRLRRFAAVALVPTVVDVCGLVVLRQGLGWMLAVADATAIAVASLLSYVLHRAVTFRSDPYVRWVELPGAFVVVAVLAGAVDVGVLSALFAGTGFESTPALVEAKVVALAVAGALRLAAYRLVLLNDLTGARQQRCDRPQAPGDRRLSVVVPAYQEADRIADSVRRLREGLADVDAVGGLEVVVVDDGSSDPTADAALAAGADQVIVQPENRGKGAAVRAGVLAARGRTIAFTDADLAYGADQVRRVLRAVEEGWDAAIGDRRHPGSRTLDPTSWLRSAGSRAINWLGYAVLLGAYRDTQSGLKAFRSDVARFLFARTRVDRFAFDIEVLHLVERHNLSLTAVPVEVTYTGRSTVSAAHDAVQLACDLLRIRHWSAEGAYEADPDELPPVGAPRGRGAGGVEGRTAVGD
ncbi:MAG TPA: glycosyltransferase [Acidimicrobiales bacterium]